MPVYEIQPRSIEERERQKAVGLEELPPHLFVSYRKYQGLIIDVQ